MSLDIKRILTKRGAEKNTEERGGSLDIERIFKEKRGKKSTKRKKKEFRY